MTVKIFITGVTGYIGGDALYALNKAQPEYEYVALVRTQEKADKVTAKFPSVRIVIGDNDDSALIKEEASKADIVLHTADSSDHKGAAKAIAEGLAAGHSAEKPGYWLHTSGTGLLTYFDEHEKRFGESSDRKFDDGDGVEELTIKMADEAFHRDVDQIVVDTGLQHGDVVKEAIVCPPTIYGSGRGPVSKRGRQAYELTSYILKHAVVPILGEGKARWNNVHVHDLSNAFVLLVEAAVAGNTSSEIWGGHKGYHFTENGSHLWGDLARAIGAKAHEMGYISKPTENKLPREDAESVAGFESVSWGLNSQGKAIRLNKYLGWTATEQSLEEEIPLIIEAEHKRLQSA